MAITCTGIVATTLSSGSPAGTSLFSSSGNNAITTIIVCNNTPSTTINLSLYVVPSGSSPYANPETTIVKDLAIPGGETVSFDQEKLVLGNGDSLRAVASVAWSGGLGLTATVSTLAV
jgi:hypothetical protein